MQYLLTTGWRLLLLRVIITNRCSVAFTELGKVTLLVAPLLNRMRYVSLMSNRECRVFALRMGLLSLANVTIHHRVNYSSEMCTIGMSTISRAGILHRNYILMSANFISFLIFSLFFWAFLYHTRKSIKGWNVTRHFWSQRPTPLFNVWFCRLYFFSGILLNAICRLHSPKCFENRKNRLIFQEYRGIKGE